jgi:hypothetical protein
MRRVLLIGLLALGVSAQYGAAGSSGPYFRVSVFARPGMSMDDVVWTGSQFLYVVNTQNTVYSAPAAGGPIQLFATMPSLVEETRCILSPGTHGFPTGVIYCHSPDNKIYEIAADGSTMSVLATLPAPYPPAADGALAFDDVGRFGYRLVAATGRSGAATPSGGVVYTISPSGVVQEVGGYKGPGGADELMIAPAGFGTLGGDALLTVDAGPSGGHVVALDPEGHTQSIASFPGDGPNPIVAIPGAVKTSATTGSPLAGIYITDDTTQNIYYISAMQLTRFSGDIFVATENDGYFWILTPQGARIQAIPVGNTLRHKGHGLEGATYVG